MARPISWESLARNYEQMGMSAEAIAAYEQAITLTSDEAYRHYLLAQSYLVSCLAKLN